jgi:hypothetical protein
MHECQGTWQALLVHLVQILDCIDERLKDEMDRRYESAFSLQFDVLTAASRYRLVPSFGRDGVRRISCNVSQFKKLTAHEYEDLLQVGHALVPPHQILSLSQVAIPVFDGLFPEPDNTRVLKLLFVMAHWQGLAKLRMHTDTTLDILDKTTQLLGCTLREFRDKTCSKYATRELKKEAEARQRRAKDAVSSTHGSQMQSARSHILQATINNGNDLASSSSAVSASSGIFAACGVSASPGASVTSGTPPLSSNHRTCKDATQATRRPKSFNLNTIKFHSLGDYAPTIARFGTTDSYSTSTVGYGFILLCDTRSNSCSRSSYTNTRNPGSHSQAAETLWRSWR